MLLAYWRQRGWHKWALIAARPLGLTPSAAMNWNTAYVWVLEATSNATGSAVPLVALRYPMVGFSRTELYVPYFYISAPLIALGYLLWQLRRKKPVAETA